MNITIVDAIRSNDNTDNKDMINFFFGHDSGVTSSLRREICRYAPDILFSSPNRPSTCSFEKKLENVNQVYMYNIILLYKFQNITHKGNKVKIEMIRNYDFLIWFCKNFRGNMMRTFNYVILILSKRFRGLIYLCNARWKKSALFLKSLASSWQNWN